MQFSIGHLVLGTTGVAIVCALLFVLPHWAAIWILLAVFAVLPVPLVSGLIYATGWGRAFLVGSVVAAAPACLWIAVYMPVAVFSWMTYRYNWPTGVPHELGSPAAKYAMFGYLAYIVFAGGIAVFVRWLVLPRDDDTPQP